MLVNVVEALRNTGGDAEAADASRKALEMPPSQGQHLHRLWLAADAVASGDFNLAADYLEDTGDEQLDKDYEFLATCVRAVIEMADADSGEAGQVFTRVSAELDAARSNYSHESMRQEPARRRAFQTAVSQLAKIRGTLYAKLWGWWTRLMS